MAAVARAKSLDHLVLTVKDIDATFKFYEQVLGMERTSFISPTDPNMQRHALKFGEQKINLHISGKEFEPKAGSVQPGSGDLCFLVEDNVDDILPKLKEKGISVLEGGQVVGRTGAQGKLRSVYVRDPDGNLIELRIVLTAIDQDASPEDQDNLMLVAVACVLPLSREKQFRRSE
ncbi:hypothetical protein LTR10_015315 [Elasticomyces elasticus]|uniref:VOC domain-containing protein n=1 Tax=Exophiala sideris TaxID=1016849 RepID=A0ABR0JJ33_9EURO|nr:hypothetical protein LTR10_015315 [Elasticomyces elasticus]KAK5030285.1 hypothetical protein LTR13_008304 [Exophiala sideris]KAK5035060.1 hypothetical protein LTS07_002495 [Exophiala sideris]KAK5065983.1 hypothetical protein LTR69_002500 [Exophiala sideris]KAK5178350.1 hypothetical protein LTR44_009226 [Eurotiomycetes sp. CCFEE 6388]